jgi:hypothetical protein
MYGGVMTNPDQADPVTSLLQGALATHEMFETYMRAGFTESQALYLTAQLLLAAAQAGPPPEGGRD